MSRSLTLGLALVLTLAATAGEPPDAPADSDEGEDKGDAEQQTPMRDPLQPPGYGARSEASSGEEGQFDPSAWHLVTTLVSGQRRTAIINGRTVREGGYVGGATVLRIRSGRVELDYRGRRFTIRTRTPSVRQSERRGESTR